MSVITKAELIDRTRVIKLADVTALLGEGYVKAYNRGYAGSQRGTQGERYQDDGVAFAGWEAYEVGTDKWNDDYTQDALLAVLGRAEVEAEIAAKQAEAVQGFDPERSVIIRDGVDILAKPADGIDPMRVVRNPNGTTHVYARAAAGFGPGESPIGAYSCQGDVYRTYAPDASSLGTYATEAEAYGAVVRNNGWYALKNCIRHADGSLYHDALEAAELLYREFEVSISVAYAMVTCASLGTGEARRPGQFQVVKTGTRSDGATLYRVHDLRPCSECGNNPCVYPCAPTCDVPGHDHAND